MRTARGPRCEVRPVLAAMAEAEQAEGDLAAQVQGMSKSAGTSVVHCAISNLIPFYSQCIGHSLLFNQYVSYVYRSAKYDFVLAFW